MTEQNSWSHSLGFEKNPTGKSDELSPRVSFRTTSNNFHSFDVFPEVIRVHDISRYPSVGLRTMAELQQTLQATWQPKAPPYAETLFEIGQTLPERIKNGQTRNEVMNTIFDEWKIVLEEQTKTNTAEE